MKKVFLLLTVLFSICQFSFAQKEQHNELKPLVYDSVFQVPDATKEELFIRAKNWLAIAFKDSKEVDQFSDPKVGIVSGKGSFKTCGIPNGFGGHMGFSYVTFHISIQVKEGRYKVAFDMFSQKNFSEKRNQRPDAYSLFSLYDTEECPSDLIKGQLWGQRMKDKYWNETLKETNTNVQYMIADLKKNMSQKVVKDDW